MAKVSDILGSCDAYQDLVTRMASYTVDDWQDSLDGVNARITKFEDHLGAPATILRHKVVTEQIPESGELCQLFMLMNRRNRLETKIAEMEK